MSFVLVDVVLQKVGEPFKVRFVLLDVIVTCTFDPVERYTNYKWQ